MKIKTRYEQRRDQANKLMLGIQLHCHLHNLANDILAGDASKLPEFQQFIQFAPAETRINLLERLERKDSCHPTKSKFDTVIEQAI